MAEAAITRKDLIAALNEDLAREYQAIIAYVNYSQVLKGAQYMTIAAELEVHAAEELALVGLCIPGRGARQLSRPHSAG